MATTDSQAKPRRPRHIGAWVTLVRGILAITLGLALIVQPEATRSTLTNFIGMFWLASGLMSIRWGATGERPSKLAVLAGVVGVLAGLIVVGRFLIGSVLNLSESLVVYLLAGMSLLTGLLHVVGGFRTGGEATRQRSWTATFLGVLEIILAGILFVSPLERGPILNMAVIAWAFLGGFLLIGDALRQRARARRDQGEMET